MARWDEKKIMPDPNGQSKSGNIRSTVGQYWLIIKKNGTNCVNFVRNCVNFVGNFVISGKFVLSFEKFWYVRKIF